MELVSLGEWRLVHVQFESIDDTVRLRGIIRPLAVVAENTQFKPMRKQDWGVVWLPHENDSL
jgi:hypothetical protein